MRLPSAPLTAPFLAAMLLAAVAAASLLAAPAARAAGKDCDGYGSLKNDAPVASGRISGGERRTPFVKGETEDRACPASGGACARKAFLVPDDGVLVSGRSGDFACATYVNGKGAETDGWLPAAAITMDPAVSSTTIQEWTGSWIRVEANIAIKPAAGGKLAIKGDATFGATDPDRVRRGAVNIGEIAGTAGLAGDRLSFAMGDNGRTLPVDGGEEFACKVWMRRVGDYLLVDDNNNCGGMNVSFRGTYVRR